MEIKFSYVSNHLEFYDFNKIELLNSDKAVIVFKDKRIAINGHGLSIGYFNDREVFLNGSISNVVIEDV